MRKNLALLLVVMIGLAGCSFFTSEKPEVKPQEKQIEVTLYYANSSNSDVITEKRQISYNDGDNLYKLVLDELLKGPTIENAYLRIPEGTTVNNVILKDGIASVDLNKFSGFGGIMDEAMARASIVNTLTALDGVEKVLITINGNDYIGASGNPVGPMGPIDFSNINTYKLYFSDANAEYLVPEMRTVDESKSPAEGIIKELIKGPTRSDLTKTIPEGTKLISLEINNGIAYVNFSKEFKENHWGGSAGETMTLYSVVDSLTELPDIKKVQFLIEGNKTDTLAGHYDILNPLDRDPTLIREEY
ncbi:MAG: GerMN domain-containing protein [Thermoanaerobacteraceae bacterium]|nr:GerMN domain-containing protein [Thermoanaerobacteraceae bacterium]